MGDDLDRAQKDGVVIGLAGVTGATAIRHEIDQLLLSEPDTFNLFLLAVSEMQEKGATRNKVGYYQLAGIHGLPTALWDGVESDKKNRSGDWEGEGYCTHGRQSFITWHRPYLAMYEQSVFHKMREIAERYPKEVRPRYRAALQKFRLPYWDYYRPRAQQATFFPGITLAGKRTKYNYDFSIPQIFTLEEVMVRQTSDDKLVRTRNPFFRYPFPTEADGGFDEKDVGNAQGQNVRAVDYTVRHPRNPDDTEGDVTRLNGELNRVREGGTKQILDMIEHYNIWEVFSTSQLSQGPSGSLELIHGNYHVSIGGHGRGTQGWMASVPTAAFDPLFWIHHCLIDRWCAIWQAAHPTKWFEGQDGKAESLEPALPFRHPSGRDGKTFWNHDQTRDTKVFGYEYEEAKGNPSDVLARFKNRHGWSKPPAEMEPLDLSKAQVFQYSEAPGPFDGVGPALGNAPQVVMSAMSSAAHAFRDAIGRESTVRVSSETVLVNTDPVAPGENSSDVAFTNMPVASKDAAPASIDETKYLRSWYIDNVVERLAYNGPFTVRYFIGEFDSDNVAAYSRAPTSAGFHYIFTSPRELCDNCGLQAEQGTLVSGTSVITPMLLDYIKIGELEDLTPEKVVPFLVANLKWRVVTAEGERKDPRTTPGFKIGVSSKLTPIDGGAGSHPLYQEFPQVIDEIVSRAS